MGSAADDYIDEVVQSVVKGNPHITTFPGTSQYNGGGGASACGLAALNCARIILHKEKAGLHGIGLLKDMMKRETLTEILSVCEQWTNTAHLEVDEIANVTIFSQTLALQTTKFGEVSLKEFRELLKALKSCSTKSAALVLTRPPEILCILKIATDTKNVFVVFDSHPRTDHPGAAFIFDTSEEVIAQYLADLLYCDPSVFQETELQWQAQLLRNYAAYIYLASSTSWPPKSNEMIDLVLSSSLTALSMKAELSELRRQNSANESSVQRLSHENHHLRRQYDSVVQEAKELRREIRRKENSGNPPPSSSTTSTRNTSSKSSSRSSHSKSGSRHYNMSLNRFGVSSSSNRTTKVVCDEKDEHDSEIGFVATYLHFTKSEDEPTPSNTLPVPRENERRPPADNKGRSKVSSPDRDANVASSSRLNAWGKQSANSDALLAARTQRGFEEEDRRLRQEAESLKAAIPNATFEFDANIGIVATYLHFSKSDDIPLPTSTSLPAPPKIEKRSTDKGKSRWIEPDHNNNVASSSRATIPTNVLPAVEDSDAQLAAKTQREFEEEDNRLRREAQSLQSVVPATFNCGICLEEHTEYMIARIQPCKHSFCRDCIRSHIRAKIGEHRFPILCPICSTERNKRGEPGMLTSDVVQQIGISEREFAIFTELELAAFSVLLHCRRCKNAVFVDKQEYEASDIIVCPLPGCNNAWCKNCSQTIQIGGPLHSCDGTTELAHLMSQRGWKRCPGCKTPTEKIDGCNHMAVNTFNLRLSMKAELTC
ncbi:hypothetical protein C8Q75DRAFT_802600 [Abortiporus biennis]|nr:hypothetical protein C8Q75DRAFT_802600 [Abortiporus biennis]